MDGYKKADKFTKDFKSLLFELGEDARLRIVHLNCGPGERNRRAIFELSWKDRKTNKSVVVELAHTIYGRKNNNEQQ